MTTKLLTPEASEALGWMIDRMPDNIFKMFAAEMDAAIRVTAMRFGLDDELVKAFSVERLVSCRPDLEPADDDLMTFEAIIFSGEHTYAVIGSGKIFHQCAKGSWRPAKLTLAEVKMRSITRVTDTIRIKAKYL